jgi:DNA-binding transcriptional MerR regulator
MRIGDLAEATGTAVETIRFYEREGLIPAAQRADNNYRMYTAAHAERLAFIRHCRNLDMTLDEIRTLLRLRDAPLAGLRRGQRTARRAHRARRPPHPRVADAAEGSEGAARKVRHAACDRAVRHPQRARHRGLPSRPPRYHIATSAVRTEPLPRRT